MKDYMYILLGDLKNQDIFAEVIAIGKIIDKWKYKNIGIKISDITGEAIISICSSQDKKNPLFPISQELKKDNQVIIYGTVDYSEHQGRKFIRANKIEIVQQSIFDNSEKYGFDAAEQVSAYRLCSITNIFRQIMETNSYLEINCRMSTRYFEHAAFDSLELVYRGHGSPGYLVISPAAQLVEFLTVTSIPRVFTSTTSFSPSYRFPHGSTEMPIIMAKAINMTEKEQIDIIQECCTAYFQQLLGDSIKYIIVRDEWGNDSTLQTTTEGTFNIFLYTTELPSAARRWESVLYLIIYLIDDKGDLLIEGCREITKGMADIATLTIYPTQFLNYTSEAPRRQLLNLASILDGENKNGRTI